MLPVLLTSSGGERRGFTDFGRYNGAMALAAGLIVVGLLVLWALILRRRP
jgi:hypothetical protein